MRSHLLTLGLLLVAAVGLAEARRCPDSYPPLVLPAACVGEASAGDARFCFGPDRGCSGSGIVLRVEPPQAPFAVTGLRLEGPLGVRAVSGFPVILLTGEALVTTVTAVPLASGDTFGRLTWIALEGVFFDDDDDDDAAECRLTLGVSAPTCLATLPGDPCRGQTCQAGGCVEVAREGACEDGNPCTVNDVCGDGVCRSGASRACPDDGNPCTQSLCTATGCVNAPVSGPACDDGDACTQGDTCTSGVCRGSARPCPDDGNPCTTAVCAAGGCRHLPATGPTCDDGDACTADDRCTEGRCEGRARRCSGDGIACTEERCVGGACRSVPLDARCGEDQCARGACRPGDPQAGADGCVAVPVAENEVCTDDGYACTDDVCTGGGCLHVPIDARCGRPDECTLARCAPERAEADADGCVVEREAAAGCAEDGDPCTDDRCDAARCLHAAVDDPAGCTPVASPFRKALGLAALARGLAAGLTGAGATAANGPGRATMTALAGRLGRVETALDSAAAALAGRVAVPARVPAGRLAETLVQQRARVAMAYVKATPVQVRAFLRVVAEARAGGDLQGEEGQRLQRRGRLLLRGTKTLKGDLRRLRRVTQTFAR